LVDEEPRSLDARAHVGDLRLDRLEGADRLAEGVAFARVRECRIVRGLRDAERLRGDADASRIEHRHGDAKTLAFLAQAVFDRAAVIVQLDLAGGGRAYAELRLRLAAHEPRRVRVDDERADTDRLARALGAREQDHVLRDRPGGDPRFLAVDHVMRAVRRQLRARAQGGGFRAGLRLGERVGAVDLARGDGPEELLLLLLGAEVEQGGSIE